MTFLLAFLKAILPSLADSLLKGLNDAVNAEMNRRAEQQLGVTTQVATDNAKAATVDKAIGETEAQPVDEKTVEGRLTHGTF